MKWQNAIPDVRGVQGAAEATFFAQQPDLENSILDLYSSGNEAAADEWAKMLVTKYTNACMKAVSDGYWRLVDYFLFKYYFRGSSGAPQELPIVDCPPVPNKPDRWQKWWDGHKDDESYLFEGSYHWEFALG